MIITLESGHRTILDLSTLAICSRAFAKRNDIPGTKRKPVWETLTKCAQQLVEAAPDLAHSAIELTECECGCESLTLEIHAGAEPGDFPIYTVGMPRPDEDLTVDLMMFTMTKEVAYGALQAEVRVPWPMLLQMLEQAEIKRKARLAGAVEPPTAVMIDEDGQVTEVVLAQQQNAPGSSMVH